MNAVKITILTMSLVAILFTVLYTFKKQKKRAADLQKQRDRRFSESLKSYKNEKNGEI